MTVAVYCVTGASGFIGAWCVARLLEAGHEVRGTVRRPDEPQRYGHLTGLDGADERLTLVGGDLLDEGSYDTAVAGAEYVLHTASPYVLDVEDPQRDLVTPAVDGTRNVLRSCARADSVRRVVLTSSVAAISDAPRTGHVLTELDWNTSSSLTRNPYYFSKAEAERAAWAFVEAEQPDWDLVVVNPSLVCGPQLDDRVNESNQVLADIVDGRQPAIVELEFVVVDVRDVADAHVAAATAQGAGGHRIIVAAESRSMRQVAELLRRVYARNRVPKVGLDNGFGTWLLRTVGWRTVPGGAGQFLRTNVGQQQRVDNSRSRELLGITYRDADAAIVDAVDDLIAQGHVARAAR